MMMMMIMMMITTSATKSTKSNNKNSNDNNKHTKYIQPVKRKRVKPSKLHRSKYKGAGFVTLLKTLISYHAMFILHFE